MDLDMKLAGRSAVINGCCDDEVATDKSADSRITQLRLHCAITAGEISRVIVGEFDHRMDYFIHGECVAALGVILDDTKHDEFGVTLAALESLENDMDTAENFVTYRLSGRGTQKCVLAMLDFHRELQELGLLAQVHLGISIASGEILFTVVGNRNRSETSHLDDVVITAARLMGIAKKEGVVIVDEVTNEGIKLMIETHDIGLVKVKGKTLPLHVFGVPFPAEAIEEAQMSNARTARNRADEATIGYEQEKSLIMARFETWLKQGKKAVVVVEGSSGFGKSCLANVLVSTAQTSHVPVCITQGKESGLKVYTKQVTQQGRKKISGPHSMVFIA
ncbi:hypothetical protein HK101_007524 [Irineochytrium annulatum]|nr:hypothetical protein HK101_007524 [Irineochytrium annulatum]